MATNTARRTVFRRRDRRVEPTEAAPESVGITLWSDVASRANRLAEVGGDPIPFPTAETFPWGDDPAVTAHVYPEAWLIVSVTDNPTSDDVEVMAASDRVRDLLERASAEVG